MCKDRCMHKRCWKLQSTAICRLSTLLQGRGCNEYLLVTSFRIHLTSSIAGLKLTVGIGCTWCIMDSLQHVHLSRVANFAFMWRKWLVKAGRKNNQPVISIGILSCYFDVLMKSDWLEGLPSYLNTQNNRDIHLHHLRKAGTSIHPLSRDPWLEIPGIPAVLASDFTHQFQCFQWMLTSLLAH